MINYIFGKLVKIKIKYIINKYLVIETLAF